LNPRAAENSNQVSSFESKNYCLEVNIEAKSGKPSGFPRNHYWLVVYLPLWKMMELVSWDYDIPK
jgi:hypothetical protein